MMESDCFFLHRLDGGVHSNLMCLFFANGFRITKPLTFADCVGDELPLGWEEVYDQQVGVYYIDHINSECFP